MKQAVNLIKNIMPIVILFSLVGCTASDEIIQEIDIHLVSEDETPFEYALYTAFLESDDWVWVNCPQSGEFININNAGHYEITGKKILDFDGDGVLDLWFMAESINRTNDFISVIVRNGTEVISGFATIVDGEVVLLIKGYVTGGSIGGTFVSSAYNQRTSKHVIKYQGHAGGFGGRANWARYYSMQNGELTQLYSIWHEYYWATEQRQTEETFAVNGEDVSEEFFMQIARNFIAPVDEYYILSTSFTGWAIASDSED